MTRSEAARQITRRTGYPVDDGVLINSWERAVVVLSSPPNYTDEEVEQACRVARLRAAGVSLQDIRKLIAGARGGNMNILFKLQKFGGPYEGTPEDAIELIGRQHARIAELEHALQMRRDRRADRVQSSGNEVQTREGLVVDPGAEFRAASGVVMARFAEAESRDRGINFNNWFAERERANDPIIERYKLAAAAQSSQSYGGATTATPTNMPTGPLTAAEQIVADYEAYKSDRVLAGTTPVSFVEWEKADRVRRPALHALADDEGVPGSKAHKAAAKLQRGRGAKGQGRTLRDENVATVLASIDALAQPHVKGKVTLSDARAIIMDSRPDLSEAYRKASLDLPEEVK